VALDAESEALQWDDPDDPDAGDGAQFVIKYMGNKRQLLPALVPVLTHRLSVGGTLLDLFAGTHAVGFALRTRGAIWANDVQTYSAVLGEALLRTARADAMLRRSLEAVLRRADAAYEDAAALFAYYLARERKVLALTRSDPDWALERLKDLHTTYRRFMVDGGGDTPRRLERYVRRVRAGLPTNPPLMATLYWAGTYFGLEQCLWLDALRSAINELPPGDPSRPLAIAGMLHAAARSTPSTGHFAQHRKLTSTSTLLDIAKYRRHSVREAWRRKVQQLVSLPPAPPHRHRVTCLDFRDLLQMPLDGVDVVYADPPYSKVHYSRFYHVLESLTLYDFPGVEYDGRYRPLALRHQSPFSIEAQAENAFCSMLAPVSDQRISLVISYSTSGVVPIPRLRTLCRRYFARVSSSSQDHVHNTMGRRGDRDRPVREVLLICEP